MMQYVAAERVPERLGEMHELVTAAMHVADHVNELGTPRDDPDLERVSARAGDHPHTGVPFALERAGLVIGHQVLQPRHVPVDRAFGHDDLTADLPLQALLLGGVQDDQVDRHALLAGDLHERLALLGGEHGRVDDRHTAGLDPRRDDLTYETEHEVMAALHARVPEQHAPGLIR